MTDQNTTASQDRAIAAITRDGVSVHVVRRNDDGSIIVETRTGNRVITHRIGTRGGRTVISS